MSGAWNQNGKVPSREEIGKIALQLKKDGLSLAGIAVRLGISQSHAGTLVREQAVKEGVDSDKLPRGRRIVNASIRIRPGTPLEADLARAVMERKGQGWTNPKIAADLGITANQSATLAKRVLDGLIGLGPCEKPVEKPEAEPNEVPKAIVMFGETLALEDAQVKLESLEMMLLSMEDTHERFGPSTLSDHFFVVYGRGALTALALRREICNAHFNGEVE